MEAGHTEFKSAPVAAPAQLTVGGWCAMREYRRRGAAARIWLLAGRGDAEPPCGGMTGEARIVRCYALEASTCKPGKEKKGMLVFWGRADMRAVREPRGSSHRMGG